MDRKNNKGSRTGHDRVPSSSWDHFKDIGPYGYSLLGALANHLNSDDSCWPSVERLSEMLNCSERTVRRARKRLEEAGRIAVHYGKGPKSSNLYRVYFDPDTGVRPGQESPPPRSQESTAPVTGVHQTRSLVSAKLEPRTRTKNQTEKKSLSRKEFEEDFEIWRQTLPEKRAARVKPTGDRWKKYQARRRDSTREEIQQALQGWVFDPWPERPTNNGFQVLLRTRGRVEKFSLLYVENSGANGNGKLKDDGPRYQFTQNSKVWGLSEERVIEPEEDLYEFALQTARKLCELPN